MNIKILLKEVAAGLDEDQKRQRSATDQKLHAVARQLLTLERDLKAPGVARSADERAERLLDAIAKESF